jgi:sirohydrochlorin ferrochelatase
MKVLLILAHGSPRPEANGDILRVAELVRTRNEWPLVKIGYLDCNEPDIPTAIDECVAAGATSIVAVPYFLHSGKHFLQDLPELLDASSERHPHVEVLMGDYIGHEPQIADVLMARVAEVKT